MAIGIPLTSTLAIIIFYELTKKITKNQKTALIASTILATIYPFAWFTAGVTKETFAISLMLLTILIFLEPKSNKKIGLFVLATITLLLSHHITTAVTLLTLTSITFALFITKNQKAKQFDKTKLICLIILAISAALYYILFAAQGLQLNFELSDWFSLIAYQIIAFSFAISFTSIIPRLSKLIKRIIYTAAIGTVLLIIFVSTHTALLVGSPELPTHYTIYLIPLLLLTPLIILGTFTLRGKQLSSYTIVIFWFTPIFALETYAIFGNSPLGIILAIRALNFLAAPVAILCAIAFTKLYEKTRTTKTKKALQTGITAFLIIIISLNMYNIYASISKQEQQLGYQWVNNKQEFNAASWLNETKTQTVASDGKFSYLLKGYFNITVDVKKAFQYLNEETPNPPKILLTYKQMQTNGYSMPTGYSLELPSNWTQKISNLNKVYSNGQVNIHTER